MGISCVPFIYALAYLTFEWIDAQLGSAHDFYDFASAFLVWTFYFAGILWGLSFIDVIWSCRSRRRARSEVVVFEA